MMVAFVLIMLGVIGADSFSVSIKQVSCRVETASGSLKTTDEPILLSQVCDGRGDCQQGVDESHVLCITKGEDCFTDSAAWQGKVSHTRGNITCQRWDSQSPHSHTRNNPEHFPDDTLADASNFCRDPDGVSTPWCYTVDRNVRWGVCNVPRCIHADLICGGIDMVLFETDVIFPDDVTSADWMICQSACLHQETCSHVEVVYNKQGLVVECKLYGTNILSLQKSPVTPSLIIQDKLHTIYLKSSCEIGCYGTDCYHLESNNDVPCRMGSPATIVDEEHLDFFIKTFPLSFMIRGMSIGFGNVTYINATSEEPYFQWQDGTLAPDIFSDEMRYGETYCVSYGFTISATNSSNTEFRFQIFTSNVRDCSRMDWYICRVEKYDGLQLPAATTTMMQTVFRCADDDFVNRLAVCDGWIDCLDGTDELHCPQVATGDCTGKFQCKDGGCVPYSVYCDFIPDCADGSDEDCELLDTCKSHERRCRNGQCVENRFICNGQQECFDGTDECKLDECQDMNDPYRYISKVSQTISGRACQAWNKQHPQTHIYSADSYFPDPSVDYAKHYCRALYGQSEIIPWCYTEDTAMRWEFCQVRICANATANSDTAACDDNQVACMDGLCISNSSLCNGISDCAQGEDEQSCDGKDIHHDRYKCQRSSKCLPRSQVCDRKIDCPLADDERLCTEHTCPSLCDCHVYEITCTNLNSSEDFMTTLSNTPWYVRSVHVSSSNLPKNISIQHNFPYISMLNMSNCGLDSVVFASMPNLLSLDLSRNKLKDVKNGGFDFKRLRILLLNNNELSNLVIDVFYNLLDLRVINVSRNYIRKLHRTKQSLLPELGVFDGSYNSIYSVTMNFFTGMTQLHTILLHHNQILTIESKANVGLDNLHLLELSNNKIETVNKDFVAATKNTKILMFNNNSLTKLHENMFEGLAQLLELSLEGNIIREVNDYAFRGLKQLTTLNIKGNRITNFNEHMFFGLCELRYLETDKYKFCCLKPHTVSFARCEPQANEFSSCENLLRNDAARLLIWVIGILALVGNFTGFLYRQFHARGTLKIGYGVFVSNLAISDFLMGIYLMVIAGADALYHGSYIWNDEAWRNSYVCVFAGILSTISSEASVFFICLVTIDRILVIRYPFGQLKFSSTSSVLASLFCWLSAFIIALMPVLNTDYFGNEFYSVNAVCIALPLTRARPRGWEYSLAVFVFFNFLTFLLIAFGQILIFKEIFYSKISRDTLSKRKKDLKVARNLLFIVSTDFMCWCPVGVMGIMALTGRVISGDVYVWASVFILPINAALNPFLYTLTEIIKKQKFSPSVDEQSQVVSLSRHAWESIWKKSQTVDPNYKTLHEVMKVRTLKIAEIVHVEATVAQELLFLHEVDMYQGDIRPKMIYVSILDEMFKHVTLKLSPKPTRKDEDKLEDIRQLGILGRILLMHALNDGIDDESTVASTLL